MMSLALIVLGVLLIGWGGVLLLTGEFVATLDIAAGLISSGVVVIALAEIVRALNRVGDRFQGRDEEELEEEEEFPLPPLDTQTSPVFPVSPIPAPAEADEPVLPEPAAAAPERAIAAVEPMAPPVVAPPVVAPPAPQPAPPVQADEPPAARPSLIREGVIDGRMYRFFDDGSIEAEGPEGVRRFKSMDEAREAILQQRRPPSDEAPSEESGDSETRSGPAPEEEKPASDVKPAPDVKADAPARQPIFQIPIREEPVEAKPAVSAPAAPAPSPPASAAPATKRQTEERKPRKPVTWESYLAAGRIQEGGEKAEGKDTPAEEEGQAAAAPPADVPPEERDDRPTATEPPAGSWAEPFRALLQDDKAKDDKKKRDKPDES